MPLDKQPELLNKISKGRPGRGLGFRGLGVWGFGGLGCRTGLLDFGFAACVMPLNRRYTFILA